MKDKKESNKRFWYEKAGIWIGIIAGICAILGISVFDSKSLIRNRETDDTTIQFEDNEIGDQSTVIVGDNNTINYGNTSDNRENPELDDLSSLESETPSVVASYDMNTVQNSVKGIDVLVKAETSFPADHVTISAVSDEFTYIY